MKKIEKHQSPVRKALAEKNNVKYTSLKSLQEAKKYKDAYLIMEGDYGGQIYLSCPVKIIECQESIIVHLLRDIDNGVWNNPDGARIYFERKKIGEVIEGGMGGGLIEKEIWIHDKLKHLNNKVRRVLLRCKQ